MREKLLHLHHASTAISPFLHAHHAQQSVTVFHHLDVGDPQWLLWITNILLFHSNLDEYMKLIT